MEESKEVKALEKDKKTLTNNLEDVDEDNEEKTLTPESSAKPKKKKKKSKLKTLLARNPNEEIPLSEVEEAISSASLEEKKALSKEDQMKFEMVIKKMNEMLPGGRKDMADHKFWKTQPVIKFGMSCEVIS
jgi:hypothetical protein